MFIALYIPVEELKSYFSWGTVHVNIESFSVFCFDRLEDGLILEAETSHHPYN